ncbi:hypothetical protein RA267_27800, partial [Pseudomonas syringae pv. tagetis]|uniref:hypothetical protein n=1 Tax=Pseudomonas syringae group genomosp. 7 TaxID=251699 RepID=UPI003770217A
ELFARSGGWRCLGLGGGGAPGGGGGQGGGGGGGFWAGGGFWGFRVGFVLGVFGGVCWGVCFGWGGFVLWVVWVFGGFWVVCGCGFVLGLLWWFLWCGFFGCGGFLRCLSVVWVWWCSGLLDSWGGSSFGCCARVSGMVYFSPPLSL